MMMINESVSIE